MQLSAHMGGLRLSIFKPRNRIPLKAWWNQVLAESKKGFSDSVPARHENRLLQAFSILLIIAMAGCTTGDNLSSLEKKLTAPSIECAVISNQKTIGKQTVELLYSNSGFEKAENIAVVMQKEKIVQQKTIASIPKNDSARVEFVFSGEESFLAQSIEWKTDWVGEKKDCNQTIP